MRSRALVAASLLVVAAVSGCADSGSSETGVDEMPAHDGQVCPRRLPQGEDPGTWLGTDEPAETAPELPPLESAWVCKYNPTETDPVPDGNDTTYAWERGGPAHPVDSSDLAVLERDLSRLVPAPTHRMCTADLGPRWMLVYSHDRNLTGVVVDGFGCREVRLTDEPFETVPGEATQGGTVSGVLSGPDDLLGDIKAAARGQ